MNWEDEHQKCTNLNSFFYNDFEIPQKFSEKKYQREKVILLGGKRKNNKKVSKISFRQISWKQLKD